MKTLHTQRRPFSGSLEGRLVTASELTRLLSVKTNVPTPGSLQIKSPIVGNPLPLPVFDRCNAIHRERDAR